jgi:hypothetical protein
MKNQVVSHHNKFSNKEPVTSNTDYDRSPGSNAPSAVHAGTAKIIL